MSLSPDFDTTVLLSPICGETLSPHEIAVSISLISDMATMRAYETIGSYNDKEYERVGVINGNCQEVHIYTKDDMGNRNTGQASQVFVFLDGVLIDLRGYNSNQFYHFNPEQQTISMGFQKKGPDFSIEVGIDSTGAYLREFFELSSGTFLETNYTYVLDDELPYFEMNQVNLFAYPNYLPLNNFDVAKIFPMGRVITIAQLYDSVIDKYGKGNKFADGGVKHPGYTTGNTQLGYGSIFIYEPSNIVSNGEESDDEETEENLPLIEGHAYPVDTEIAENAYLAIVGINSKVGEIARAFRITIDPGKIRVVEEMGVPIIEYEIIIDGVRYNLSRPEMRGARVAASETTGKNVVNNDGTQDYIVLRTADEIREQVTQGWYRDSMMKHALMEMYFKYEERGN